MHAISSEQALTTLEKSKSDPELLLDDAADIADITYDGTQRVFVPKKSLVISHHPPDFRLQWLLKWLVKKLNESISNPRFSGKTKPLNTTSQDSSDDYDGRGLSLLTSPKTWAMLSFLLQTISHHASRDILLERRFTQLLVTCGDIIHDQHLNSYTASDNIPLDDINGNENDGQPRKKRKISPDADGKDTKPKSGQHLAQFLVKNYLRVVSAYAHIITKFSNDTEDIAARQSRHAIPAWAQTLDDASKLLHSILQSAVDSFYYPEIGRDVSLVPIVNSWLEMWRAFAAATKSADKYTKNKCFCEQGLNLCLQLLRLIPDISDHRSRVDLKNAIEGQIALNVILPIRAQFNESFSGPWKTGSDHVQWKVIEPLYNHVVDQLGSSLHREMVLGVEYVSFGKTYFARDLFTIGTKIIPKNDLRRRRWERPWLDAFYLTLFHLAFPQHMYRLEVGEDSQLVPENEDLPFDSQQVDIWPAEMLTAILEHHPRASLSTAMYVCNSVLRWRLAQIPPSILAQLVHFRAEAFIPTVNDANHALCLDLLIDRMDDIKDILEADFTMLTGEVIRPLVRAFALSRSLPEFLDLWLPRLQIAFRTRSSTQVQATDSSLLWDDEVVFEEFESAVKINSGQHLAKAQLQTVIGELEMITQRIGPTTDIFARLAICNSVIRAGTSDGSSNTSHQDYRVLSKLVCAALHQQSDYQGQRWRLWQVLKTVLDQLNHEEVSEVQELLAARAAYQTIPVEHNLTNFSSAFLMECLHSFSVVVRFGTSEAVEIASTHLKTILNTFLDEIASITTNIDPRLSTTWNGRFTDLVALPQLACGYLGYLLQESTARLLLFKHDLGPVTKRCVEVISESSVAQILPVSYLLTEVELLFSIFSQMSNENLLSHYIDIILDAHQVDVPHGLHSLPLEGVEKGVVRRQAERIVDRLVQRSNDEQSTSVTEVSPLLALLSRLVIAYPVSIGLPEHFSRLVQAARVLDVGERELGQSAKEHLHVSLHCVSKILRSAWHRLLHVSNADKQKSVIKTAYKWSKQVIKDLKDLKDGMPRLSELLIVDLVLSLMYSSDLDMVDQTDIQRYQRKYMNIVLALPLELHTLQSLVEVNGTLTGYVQRVAAEAGDLDAQALKMLSKISMCNPIRSEDQVVLPQPQGAHIMTKSKVQSFIQDMQTELRLNKGATVADLLGSLIPSNLFDINAQTAFQSAVVIANIGSSDSPLHQTLVSQLSNIAALGHTKDSSSPQSLVLALGLSKLVLTNYPEVVGQSTIDILMESLCLTCSGGLRISMPQPQEVVVTSEPSADAIYSHLLTTMDILLSRYRRRLNGRSHLLLVLLQALLRCLFYTPEQTYIYQNPANAKQKQAFRFSLPAWLQDGRSQPLSPTSAERFSRILSSICNPSTASARSAHGHRKMASSSRDLNDETQQAKRIASQYMQYLIMEYARCTLDGVIAPQTRDKLMPGLYSVLDALGRDMMRTMNAAMDPSSRAIFKGLYDDWVKYGKWDQT